MEDIDSMMIERSKFMADGDRYFKLFEKHVPVEITGNVLLMTIGNIDCLAKLINLNKNAKYFVVENTRIIKCLDALFSGELSIEPITSDDLDLYNIIKGLDMKFDCIIQNPPYSRNLHLKILAEAIKHLSDDGVCVNLSPAQYLQDPLAKIKKASDYNRFKELVSEHIAAFDLYKKYTMSQTFNIAVNTDLAVYVCTKNGGFPYDEIRKYRGFDPLEIYDRCLAKVGKSNSLNQHVVEYKDRTSENFVSVTTIGGINYRDIPSIDCIRRGIYGAFCNGKHNGKSIKEIKASCKLSVWGNVDNWPIICFDTPEECINFFNATDTVCYHFLSYAFTNDQNVPLRFLPWLGEATNPRTGLKGYKGEWTDEDLYKFFNITPEEQKVIEETMEKYK